MHAPYLEGFDHDIFISYGWSDEVDPAQGHRGWISALVKRLETELGERLGSKPKLYLDARASWNGRLDDNLRRAIESSALLVFAESPGSCKPKSWCQFEVQHFLDRAKPIASGSNVITREDRILKLVLKPVPKEEQPAAVQEVVGRRLYENGRPASFTNSTSEASIELDGLIADIEELLKAAKKLGPAKTTGSGVFVSAGSYQNVARLRQLRKSLEQNGHRTLATTRIAGEPEDRFLERTELALRETRVAVHLLGESEQKAPDGWRRTTTAWQVRQSLQRSRDADDYSVFIWEDPNARWSDDTAASEVGGDFAIGKRDQHIHGGDKGFDYLESNLNKRLTGDDKLAGSGPIGQAGPLMVIEAHEDDVEAAAELLCAPLERKGYRIQFAVPTGKNVPPVQRKRRNKAHYANAQHHVVYFGRSTWLWADDTCDAMREHLRLRHSRRTTHPYSPELTHRAR